MFGANSLRTRPKQRKGGKPGYAVLQGLQFALCNSQFAIFGSIPDAEQAGSLRSQGYSYLNAAMGSSAAARRAGMRLAATPTAARTTTAATIVTGSAGFKPYSIAAASGPTASASAVPAA